jgi:hypothetical protein
MLIVAAALISGCSLPTDDAVSLVSPYADRRVFAVAPLENESGSIHADGVMLADQLARQLENATHIDVLPVNRTLAAMEARGMSRLRGRGDAMRLLGTLGVDALLVGSIAHYDAYDPPKIGLAIELFVSPRFLGGREPVDIRQLAMADSGPQTQLPPETMDQPVSSVSAFFDAASPQVRRAMRRYAHRRGPDGSDRWHRLIRLESPAERQAVRAYRISMDLFSEFVSYEMSWRLLLAEMRRLGTTSVAQAAP